MYGIKDGWILQLLFLFFQIKYILVALLNIAWFLQLVLDIIQANTKQKCCMIECG